MKHSESSIKIYFTNDYSAFKNLKGNRLLNERKIKKIMADISDGLNFLKYCPIIVSKEMEIIDGQHRFYVAKKLKENVWYVIYNNDITLHAVAKLNSNTERWKPQDFINCYTTIGTKDYKALQEFIDKYNFPLSFAIRLLSTGKAKTGGLKENPKNEFEAGNFRISSIHYAYEFADFAMMFNKLPQWNSRNFLLAIHRIFKKEGVEIEKLLEKFNDNINMLERCSSEKDYLRTLEDIYNIHRQKRQILF